MPRDVISLESCRAFLAVVRTGGFARAEAELNLTQSAISKRVLALEKALGTSLFERRGPRPVALTEAGRQLQEVLEPLVDAIDDLPSLLERRLAGKAGMLRVLAGQSDALHVLPGVVASFIQTHARVQMQVRVARSEVLMRAVLEGKADVGVTSRRPGLGTDLMFLPLASSPLVAIVAVGHPLTDLRSVSPEILSRYGLVLPDSESALRSAIRAAFHSRGLVPKVVVEAGGWDVIRTYVALGCGIGLVPVRHVPANDRSVVALPVEPPLPPSETGVVLREAMLQDPGVRDFLKLLYRSFGSPVPPVLMRAAGKRS